MSDLTPLTREEYYLARMAGEDVEVPDPITREEFFMAKIAGEDVSTPDPITREEFYLANIAKNVNDVSGDINVEDSVAKGYLYSIRIPDGVTSIDNEAFGGCGALKSLTIPDSVTSIGSSAFYGCHALESLTISSSVTSIGSNAFSGCESLESLTLKGTTPPTLSKVNVFTNMPNDCVIYVPTGSLEAYQTADKWSTWASQMVEEE